MILYYVEMLCCNESQLLFFLLLYGDYDPNNIIDVSLNKQILEELDAVELNAQLTLITMMQLL